MRVKEDVAGVYDPSLYDSSYRFLSAPYYRGDSTRPDFANLGERYDYHSIYKGANNIRIALQYFAGKHISVRGSFGQGFRAPSPYYQYASPARKDGDSIYYVTVPNETLKPERLISAEAGLRWDPGKNYSLDASFFYHKLENQFTRSLFFLDPGLYPMATNSLGLAQAYVNDNASSTRILGLQAALKVDDLVRSVHLSGELILNVSKGKEALPNDLGSIDSYRQWPVFHGQLNLSVRPANVFYLYIRNVFSTGWTWQYFPVSKEVLDALVYDTETRGFYTLDLLARLNITRNFQAFFQWKNIFNANYAGIDAYRSEGDLIYNPQYGRNFRFRLSFSME